MLRAVIVMALALAACGDDAGTPGDAGPADARAPDAGTDAGPAADAGPEPEPRAAEAPLVQHVDPRIATGGLGFGVGSAFPGPQRPFGMVRPGPDTTTESGAPGFTHCSGYSYADELIRGFSHTRMHGTGIADYGAVALMPVVGMDDEATTERGHRARFSHDTEVASPGYYAVTLEDDAHDGVRVELTATDRVALHRYTFPEGEDDAVVLVDLGHFMAEVTIEDGHVVVDAAAGEVHGYSHFRGGYSGRFGGMPVYFVARFERPVERYGTWADGVMEEHGVESEGSASGAYVRFDASTDREVVVAVGVSFVDVEHARTNLDAEARDLDFDRARREAEAAWEEALSVVELEGRHERDFGIFYTALYHALLMPTLASDVDGSYRGLDGEVHVADGFRYYTDFSLWDTFRTQHPLLTLLYPAYQTDMLRSLVAMARDGGYMPRWPLGIGYTGGMVGDSACVVFADSWRKGLRDFDLRAAYDAMVAQAMGPTPEGAPYGGRNGIAEYVERGYVPIEASGSSASHTLEFAYDDWALAHLAEALGETEQRDVFMERARGYRHLFHEPSGFLLGRHADGSFPEDVDEVAWQDFYAEGNVWQYNFYTPHDMRGLAELLGGRDALLARLDGLFEQSASRPFLPVVPGNWYWHGNEPDLHYAWIYADLDRPAPTARWTRWILQTRYGDGPDGLPGNDDAGTLSAWYVFTSSGFFAIAGADDYLVGSPIFTKVTMHLPGGDFVIDAPEASWTSMYVQDARWQGEPLERARIDHATVAAGGTLSLTLGTEPSAWAER